MKYPVIDCSSCSVRFPLASRLPLTLLCSALPHNPCTNVRLPCRHRFARIAYNIFGSGQALGEGAVAADESSPGAHFALFCNLGEQLRVDGESLSSLSGFRRIMKELNRTPELAPAHLDALSAKGTV